MSGVPLRVMLELREDVAARDLMLTLGAAIDELVCRRQFSPEEALAVFTKHNIDIVRRPK